MGDLVLCIGYRLQFLSSKERAYQVGQQAAGSDVSGDKLLPILYSYLQSPTKKAASGPVNLIDHSEGRFHVAPGA